MTKGDILKLRAELAKAARGPKRSAGGGRGWGWYAEQSTKYDDFEVFGFALSTVYKFDHAIFKGHERLGVLTALCAEIWARDSVFAATLSQGDVFWTRHGLKHRVVGKSNEAVFYQGGHPRGLGLLPLTEKVVIWGDKVVDSP